MTTEQVRRVAVEYHQFNIVCDEEIVEWDGVSENGLATLGDQGGAVVLTNIALGFVRYSSFAHQDQPEVDFTWDDIVEVTLHTTSGEIHIVGFAGGTFDEQNLAIAGAGTYRLRISARDRGTKAEYDIAVETATEQFRFDIWPSEQPEQTTVIKSSAAPT